MMKSFLTIFRILAFCATLVTGCQTAQAQYVTATITVTNIPSDGDTIVLDGSTRTFKTTVVTPSIQIQIGASSNATATNLFLHLAANPIPTTILSFTVPNVITLQGPGLTATKSGTWGSIATSSSTEGSLTAWMLPATAVPDQAAATNLASYGVSAINDYSTNAFKTNTAAMSNYVDLVNGQSLSNKSLYQSTLFSPVINNGQNFGNPFRSPGTGTGSEQFGLGASAAANAASAFGDNAFATGVGSSAFGDQAGAGNDSASAFGAFASAGGDSSLAAGSGANALGDDSVALGASASAGGNSAIAIGNSATAAQASSVAIGIGATTTTSHQITLGTSAESVNIPGNVNIQGAVSNLSTVPSSTNVFNGALIYPSVAVNTFANSNNAALHTGTNSYFVLSGPTGSFFFSGADGGVPGREIFIENGTGGQIMVVGHQSGVALSAGDRIITGYGVDRQFTNNPAIIGLRYDGTSSRWKIFSVN